MSLNEKAPDTRFTAEPGFNLPAVQKLLEAIKIYGGDFVAGDSFSRSRLLDKTRALSQALETPRETLFRQCWTEPTIMCSLATCSELDLWTRLISIEGPFIAAEVAEDCGVEPSLLSRLMRHLAAAGYLHEVGPDTYGLTSFTRAMALPVIGKSYPCIAGGCLAALYRYHEYHRAQGWKESHTAMQWAYKTNSNIFAYLHANPPYGDQFNLHMGAFRLGSLSWADEDFYPVTERLVRGFKETPHAVMIVDVGGSVGYDLEELLAQHPNVPGRLVLQDLPHVLKGLTPKSVRIECLAHDFFKKQPIEGARAYLMRSVLHDWSDEDGLKILANVTAAMVPGHSKLLLVENIMPERNAEIEKTSMDIAMMALVASKERTLEEWDNLLRKAKLKVIEVWSSDKSSQSLIECELV